MKIGDIVYINSPESTNHRKTAKIVNMDKSKTYSYQAQIDGDDFAFWYKADMLILASPDESPHDFGHSGLGIGGLGSHSEPSAAPTAKQIERAECVEREAQYCKRCGRSDVFGGAMFTTAPWSGYCDDCF